MCTITCTVCLMCYNPIGFFVLYIYRAAHSVQHISRSKIDGAYITKTVFRASDNVGMIHGFCMTHTGRVYVALQYCTCSCLEVNVIWLAICVKDLGYSCVMESLYTCISHVTSLLERAVIIRAACVLVGQLHNPWNWLYFSNKQLAGIHLCTIAAV